MIIEFSEKSIMLMQLLYGRLSEKDRRQYAAIEFLKLGRDGITYIAKVLGVDRKNILRGIKELDQELIPLTPLAKQRKVGVGRKTNRCSS